MHAIETRGIHKISIQCANHWRQYKSIELQCEILDDFFFQVKKEKEFQFRSRESVENVNIISNRMENLCDEKAKIFTSFLLVRILNSRTKEVEKRTNDP